MKLFNVHVILLHLGEGNIARSNRGLFEQIMQCAMESDWAKSSGVESPTGDTTAQGAAAAVAAEFPSPPEFEMMDGCKVASALTLSVERDILLNILKQDGGG
jgi:hypothetical protein